MRASKKRRAEASGLTSREVDFLRPSLKSKKGITVTLIQCVHRLENSLYAKYKKKIPADFLSAGIFTSEIPQEGLEPPAYGLEE